MLQFESFIIENLLLRREISVSPNNNYNTVIDANLNYRIFYLLEIVMVMKPGVNFTYILRTAFTYVSCACTFFVLAL